MYIADFDATVNKSISRVRRVGPDGIITTVAGSSQGFSGDGGPAGEALLNHPSGMAVAQDGSLYIADNSNSRIRRVGPDGIITTVAGGLAVGPNGTNGFSGDGVSAVAAQLNGPTGVAVGPDGSLYIADMGNSRIRRVGPDGIITTVAGNGRSGFSGDGGPAVAARLQVPAGVAVGPDGNLYITDVSNSRIRRIQSALPEFSASDILLSSEDGREVYIFDNAGRHLKTLNALTGSVRYQFGYDSVGQLISITDGDGNVTAITRDASGNPTALMAPGGQRTTLTVDTNGYLATVTNPANELVQLSYTAEGLLLTETDPKGGLHRYGYDALGRLIRDEDPAGGVQTLARVDTSTGHTVTRTTALGRTSTYQVEQLPTGAIRHIDRDPHGARTEVVRNLDGTQRVTYPDGATLTSTLGPDPRFGMQAPRLVNRVRTLPGGQTETTTTQRTVTLTDPNNLLSLQTLVDTATINGRTFTRSYNAATRTITDTSAEGRTIISVLDAQGRVIRRELVGIAPITVTYDSHGRVIENRQGAQFRTFSYDTRNRVVGRVDAAGHRITWDYDNNDRIIQKTLASGAAYHFTYDANGNRTQVILPSGARHDLGYTSVNLDVSYTPPGNGSYVRTFNVDRQLTRTTLPGGRFTDQGYDAAGRVTDLRYLEAATSFDYFANDRTDRVAVIRHTPSGAGPAQDVAYSYNGSLINGMTASGAAPAQVSYSYDNDFFLTSMNLVSDTDTVSAALEWDRDGILSRFGPFTLTRGGPGGALSQISDGTVNTHTNYTYDTLARMATRTHQVSGQAPYTMRLSYDTTERMTGKTETVGGTPHTYAYTYDLDGQLTEVRRDGIVSERYAYDLNGNRTSRQFGTDPLEVASYDEQDRLLQRGAVAYRFNASGFLTQRGGHTFHYSSRGQLLEATVGGQVITYAYDGLGRRVSRTDGSGTSQYLYGDPASHLVTAVRNPAGALTALYYDTAGLLMALERGGTRYYVATDQVGTPRVVTNSTGTVIKVLAYDSFGQLTDDSNPAFDLPIGYAGGLADPVTGLVHFGFRDYEPDSGRWTARDPVLFEGRQGNLYVYVGNSPLTYRDPSGLFCVSVSAYEGVGGGVGFCITDEGASVCGELGFGVGVNVEADIGGGLEKTGTQLVGELSASWGPVEIGVEASLDSSGCAKVSPKGQIGPETLALDKLGLELDVHGSPKIGGGAEAKLAGKGCIQGKF